jgi:hypothetical protein
VDANNPRLFHFNTFEGGEGPTPADQFIRLLLEHGDRKTKNIVIGHNSGKFDLHLLLSAIYRRNLAPKLIMTGQEGKGKEISQLYPF